MFLIKMPEEKEKHRIGRFRTNALRTEVEAVTNPEPFRTCNGDPIRFYSCMNKYFIYHDVYELLSSLYRCADEKDPRNSIISFFDIVKMVSELDLYVKVCK